MSNQRLLTASYLHQISNTKNSDLVQRYFDLMRSISKHQFRCMISFTFTKPVTDIIAVYEVCRRAKRILNRHFYRRREKYSETRFLFIVEPHYLDHKSKQRFHVHFLMPDIVNCKRACAHFPEQLRRSRFKKDVKKLYRIRSVELNSRARVARIKFSKIYDQENLADYLLKELKHSAEDLYQMIDFENSDLSFD